jgi:hypothetical protein
MQLKLSKYFLFKTLIAKRIIINNFFVKNFNSKKNYHKEFFLVETKITKSVFEYNDKTL